MNNIPKTGNEIRESFIDFFKEKGHKFVKSSSLVPGGDSTLLFTNAGMVQFKDIFLGTEQRDYNRAVNSQKCMRVAGKHNDLEDVGRDDSHHTFFEMLGNWSFGDYYKKEAISWAWELLTDVWKFPKDRLYATVFKDELKEIPTDEDAARYWLEQPGFKESHLFYEGRKEIFWEMGDTGPCGPSSEIHYDLHPELGPVKDKETINSERFIEIWNLVFIQYNRVSPDHLEPLPATHVDTGMGFERVVAILQNSGSNYKTDLFLPLLRATQALTGDSDQELDRNITPYRVIADHARAAAFLIADGVVPGNIGRNYVCRMIIRRAFRFGGHLELHKPFLAEVAKPVIENYKEAYPELERNQQIILKTITREEEQFQETLENATYRLENMLHDLKEQGKETLPGDQAAHLYTTYGMPLEITRDIAEEKGLEVDDQGFREAMEEHRLASGKGESMGDVGGKEVKLYRDLLKDLQKEGKLDSEGVHYDPYGELEFSGEILALVHQGERIERAQPGQDVNVIVPRTPFYLEAGGQVSDTGMIAGENWQIDIRDVYQPAAGVIVHVGNVRNGNPEVGEEAAIIVDSQRRKDIMRNHTGTHLLHAALDEVLGEHARQAGSLVAPDRLRFDFTHNEALSNQELETIEEIVNQRILENHPLRIAHKPLQEAVDEGARALFGEKYGDVVRTVKMGTFSYELCGGTHSESSGDLGIFLITHEGSAAAGIRRIEAVTGRKAYQLVQRRFRELDKAASYLSTGPDQVAEQTKAVLNELDKTHHELESIRERLAFLELNQAFEKTSPVQGIHVLSVTLKDVDMEALRRMADRFRQEYPEQGVAVLATIVDHSPQMIAAVTKDLVARGIRADELVTFVAEQVDGGGGGRPTLAQAGGKSPEKLEEALKSVAGWVERQLA
ncbi:MAG: alanine--tRNA ligase [Anaerolineales bacterium]|nr:alanine--tRNA ligase [Anaerolineales bacterium]MBS3752662.1 alanine--tRNA ligase [Anaerolineales bacterium]